MKLIAAVYIEYVIDFISYCFIILLCLMPDDFTCQLSLEECYVNCEM